MFKHLVLGLSVGISATGTFAQTDIKANTGISAYLQDSRGVIVRSGQGLCWRTGSWTPADAVAGCDGELVIPIAKPTAPELITPSSTPVPAAPQKHCDFVVTLGSDQAFAFNKSALTEPAKKSLDDTVLGKLASCSQIETILVTGHADRLGSQQYNQKLSEKRADAVASYLKSKGVSTQIETLGAGKTQPVKSCNDHLTKQQLIECLAPNRRVVIEVRGIAK